MQRINVTFPKDVLKDLKAIVPQGKRSAFIAQAVKDKLRQEDNPQKRLQKSLKDNEDFYNSIAQEWSELEIELWPEK